MESPPADDETYRAPGVAPARDGESRPAVLVAGMTLRLTTESESRVVDVAGRKAAGTRKATKSRPVRGAASSRLTTAS